MPAAINEEARLAAVVLKLRSPSIELIGGGRGVGRIEMKDVRQLCISVILYYSILSNATSYMCKISANELLLVEDVKHT